MKLRKSSTLAKAGGHERGLVGSKGAETGASLMVSGGDGSGGLGEEIKKMSRQKAQWNIAASAVWDHATPRLNPTYKSQPQ